MDKIKLSRPTVVFVAGGPSTGKTTLIKNLLPKVEDSLWICAGDIKKSFLARKIHPYDMKLRRVPHSPESRFSKRNVMVQAYHSLLEISRANLEVGKTPFPEGNYTKPIIYDYFQKVAFPFFEDMEEKPDFKMLFCYTDEKTVVSRIRDRNSWEDVAKLKSDKTIRAYLDSQNFYPQEALSELDHLVLRGENFQEANVEKALEYLVSD